MGELVEMMLNGTLCEGCGVYLGDAVGHPRRCKPCKKNQRTDALRDIIAYAPSSGKDKMPTVR